MTNTIAPPTLEELNERIVAIEDLRNTWRDLPSKTPFDLELYCLYAVRDGGALSETLKKIATYKNIIREYRQRDLIQAPPQSLVSSENQSPWMDIETAPKDGSRILIAFANRHVCEAYWHKYWTNPCSGDVIVRTWRNDDDPISWMPLPVPPTQNTQNAKDPHNHGEGDQSVMPDRSGGEQ